MKEGFKDLKLDGTTQRGKKRGSVDLWKRLRCTPGSPAHPAGIQPTSRCGHTTLAGTNVPRGPHLSQANRAVACGSLTSLTGHFLMRRLDKSAGGSILLM